MKNKSLLILLLAFTLLFLNACNDNKPTIEFERFSVILPPPVASGTAAYGMIKNTGNNSDTLIEITSNAGDVMLHKSEIINGVAQMTHIPEYTFAPHSKLSLKPMSYHLMLMSINHNVVKENGSVLLSFKFKQAGIKKIEVPVVLSFDNSP